MNENVEHLALVIGRPPEVHPPPVHRDEHLVEMLACGWIRTRPAHPASVQRAERFDPGSDCLIGHVSATLCQKVLNVAKAQAELKVEPQSMLDYGRGKQCRAYKIVITSTSQNTPTCGSLLTCQSPQLQPGS